MTTPDQSKGDRSRDEVLAGEYVLGVLGAEERMKVEARLRHDRPFAAMVHRWEDNLSGINDEYGFELPPAALFKKMEKQVYGQAEARSAFGVNFGGLWNSLVFWRFLAFASVLVVAAVATVETGLWNPQSPGKTLVAEMVGKDNAISLVARYDGSSGRLQVTPVAAGEQQAKSLELWLIKGSDPALSLGVLPQTGEIIVPDAMRARFAEGVILAVSVEPYGGSPTGQATGPLIARGAAHP